MTPARKRRIVQYTIEYFDALQQQEAGDAVIFYMDESYCHQGHCLNSGWVHDGVTGTARRLARSAVLAAAKAVWAGNPTRATRLPASLRVHTSF